MGKSIHRQFERHLVMGRPVEQFDLCAPSEVERLDSNLKNALANIEPFPFPLDNSRRLNNFCLGSDPEFVLVPLGSGHKYNAVNAGMKPGVAIGCDQNQRLAELRGYPTPSVVEHVAGILSSFRWLWRKVPDSRLFQWRAGAFFDGDGIGGHVHFGRKRPNREQEVAALDGLATVFKNMQLFSVREWDNRMLPDAHNNHGYGKMGDIRPQRHGYEYRTLPSWLCHPLKAFLILTASKLTVLDPELTPAWMGLNVDFNKGLELLLRQAKYFAGRDDDAWLMKSLLGNPAFLTLMKTWGTTAKDFKPNWGFQDADANAKAESVIFPAVIAPTKGEVAEVGALVSGQVNRLTFTRSEPTFRASIPKDYHAVIEVTGGRGLNLPGGGDLMYNLVGYDGDPVPLLFDRRFCIGRNVYKRWTVKQQQLAKSFYPDLQLADAAGGGLILTRDMLTLQELPKLRKFLLTTSLFPLWTVESVQENSYREFLKVNPNWRQVVLASKPKERLV